MSATTRSLRRPRSARAYVFAPLFRSGALIILQWHVGHNEGTRFMLLNNGASRSGSGLKAFWPPESGQKLVGSHTPEKLQLTSAWAIESTCEQWYR
jgi:hypothetical protein